MPQDRPRVYDNIFRWHLKTRRQMIFISGPRQVGKTTASKKMADLVLNYDIAADRKLIINGDAPIHERLKGVKSKGPVLVVLFDELHRHPKWRNVLKGLFDGNEKNFKMIVTGSSRLEVFRRAGDALTGRYFSYRMHPFSVGELARHEAPEKVIHPPAKIKDSDWQALLVHGGFPEPFIGRDKRLTEQWRLKRYEILTRQDLRELTKTTLLHSIEDLAHLLSDRSGTQLNVANLAEPLGVSPNTVKAWIKLLANLHWGFMLRPWSKSVSRSLRKEPKWYNRDWAAVPDEGARFETMVACHLLKAVEGWTDLGFGVHELYYLRNKEHREVDFLVTRNRKPWFLVEAKVSDKHLSPHLSYFHKMLDTDHAIQVVRDMPFDSDEESFGRKLPVVVSARSFLSQLL